MGQLVLNDMSESTLAALVKKAGENDVSVEEMARRVITQVLEGSPATDALFHTLAQCRQMTPGGPRPLAEEVIRQMRDAE